MDFISPLAGFLFFVGMCVAMYKVGRIRDDVREIKDLLKKEAGEPLDKPEAEPPQKAGRGINWKDIDWKKNTSDMLRGRLPDRDN